MKILSVVGARPQFVKASALSLAFRDAGMEEILVHTDQHYDENMSDVFFRQMGIPKPSYNLGVGSGTHAAMTARCMERIEEVCLNDRPDIMNVYGDTNSTLAGALVAAKLGIPVSHVEAGLRSFDRSMPEEVNRIVSDRLAEWCFCSSPEGEGHLAAEGITKGVHVVGDIMYDVLCRFRPQATAPGQGPVPDTNFCLVTIHRDFNTDSAERLRPIVEGLLASDIPVVFPVHPRVRKQLAAFDLLDSLTRAKHVTLLDPVGYLDMLGLLAAASVALTDSGGLQKEAMWMATPCLTVRPSTEWVETVSTGWNRLLEPDEVGIAIAGAEAPSGSVPDVYGDGEASGRIVQTLLAAGN